MSTHHQILIVGAGTAGITVAAQLLRKNNKLDVAIIDPAETHYYQPAWTLVGAGTYTYQNTARPMKGLIPRGAKWIQDAVSGFEPEKNTLTTTGGQTLTYDYLVVCPGIKIDLDGIEGLRDTMGKNNVTSVYVDPNYTWKVLNDFKGGNAIFTQPATPIKCGGAPQKIMYLADDYFRKRKVRDKSQIMFATPGSVIFGVEPFKSTLMKVVDRKDISLKFFHKPIKIEGDKKRIHFQIVDNVDNPAKLNYNPKDFGAEQIGHDVVAVPFEMLHLAPPQAAPDFVSHSPLAHAEGPGKGWLNVDHFTLQHNVYQNVFGLGDAAHLPTAKTGAAIRKQAPVVVENLFHLMAHDGKMDPGYHGYSSCPLVTGYGKMLLAEFKYDNVRDSDPLITKFVDTSKEQWSMWMLKKYGLPYMYWNLMLKGKA